jgi:hypothetical protein
MENRNGQNELFDDDARSEFPVLGVFIDEPSVIGRDILRPHARFPEFLEKSFPSEPVKTYFKDESEFFDLEMMQTLLDDEMTSRSSTGFREFTENEHFSNTLEEMLEELDREYLKRCGGRGF